MTAAVSGLTLAAVAAGAFILGCLTTATAHLLARWRRLDEAEQHARLAWDVGYRAGLVEGMEAANREWDLRVSLEQELAARTAS